MQERLAERAVDTRTQGEAGAYPQPHQPDGVYTQPHQPDGYGTTGRP